MTDAGFAVFVNGTYGVGKSSTLDHIGDLLAHAAVPFSLMDVDWFHRSWPVAADDPDNVILEAANMAAVWANYRAAGPRRLVVAGVIADAADRRRYEEALRLPIRAVRLDAPPEEVATRLERRYHADRRGALEWHLERHAALSARLADADLDETVLPTAGRTSARIAGEIVEHFGLLGDRARLL